MKNTIEIIANNTYSSYLDEIDANILELLNTTINSKQVLLCVMNDSRSIILHPYFFVIEESLYLCAFNNSTNKIEHFDVMEIKQVSILNLPYRKLLKQEEIYKKQIVGKSITNNNSGMQLYWEEFNKNATKYNVGVRNQWYNEIKNIEFKGNEGVSFKSYVEICCQYGHQKQLIINAIVQARNKIDVDKVAKKYKELRNEYKNGNIILLDKWQDKSTIKETGNLRLKAQLASIKLKDIEDEIKDPKTSPTRKSHFDWFDDRLDEIVEIFKSQIE